MSKAKKLTSDNDQQQTPTSANDQSWGPADAGKMMDLSIQLIAESTTNPRKTFHGIEQLADSIRATGLHQPVVVRPSGRFRVEPGKRDGKPCWFVLDHNDRLPSGELSIGGQFFAREDQALAHCPMYELVFGARRLRACILAGATTIPAIVRKMDDAAVRIAQIVENNQREDVNPMEEALSYQEAIDKDGFTVDRLAAEMGRTDHSYVAKRIRLLVLILVFQEMLLSGKILLGHGLVACRYSDKAQENVLDAWNMKRRDEADWECPTVADLRNDFGQAEQQLKDAPFDLGDAELIPGCGACTTCPYRTGNSPGLFDDVDPKEDLCLNRECFTAKRLALVQRSERKLRDDGVAFIRIAQDVQGDWTKREEATKAGWLQDGQYEVISAKVAKALPADQVRRALVSGGKGLGQVLTVKVVPELIKRLTENGTLAKEVKAKGTVSSGGKYDYKAEQIKREREEKISKAAHAALWLTIGAAEFMPNHDVMIKLLKCLARAALKGNCYGVNPLPAAYGWKETKATRLFESWVVEAGPDELVLLMVRAAMSRSYIAAEDMEMLAILGIDMKALTKKAKADVLAQEKAAEKAKGQPKPGKKGKKASAGVCSVCGCTEDNCEQCIEATGEPCTWANKKKDPLQPLPG